MDFTNGPFTRIAEGVHVAVCEPEGVNVGLVIGDDAALLVDTGSSPEQGRALLEQARALSAVPVTHAVITHDHHDHWFGVAGMPDITSIAQDGLHTPTGDSRRVLDELGLGEAPLPSEDFSVAKVLDLGNLRIELLHFGPAHTQCDLFVWVPQRNVCFVGDLLEESGDPQFGPDSNPMNWPTAIDGMVGATNDTTIFVPGHGKPVDRMFAFTQGAEIAMLYGQAEMLIHQGIKLHDAPSAAEWPFSEETLFVALPLIYQQLEERGVKARTHLPLA